MAVSESYFHSHGYKTELGDVSCLVIDSVIAKLVILKAVKLSQLHLPLQVTFFFWFKLVAAAL